MSRSHHLCSIIAVVNSILSDKLTLNRKVFVSKRTTQKRMRKLPLLCKSIGSTLPQLIKMIQNCNTAIASKLPNLAAVVRILFDCPWQKCCYFSYCYVLQWHYSTYTMSWGSIYILGNHYYNGTVIMLIKMYEHNTVQFAIKIGRKNLLLSELHNS